MKRFVVRNSRACFEVFDIKTKNVESSFWTRNGAELRARVLNSREAQRERLIERDGRLTTRKQPA